MWPLLPIISLVIKFVGSLVHMHWHAYILTFVYENIHVFNIHCD